MSTHGHGYGSDVQRELAPLARDLRKAIPEVYAGFHQMHAAALAPGALDTKVKELIALAISVTEGCDGCVASHARGAVRAGATLQEAAEAIGVAVLMNGGPATVHGPRAFAAVKEAAESFVPVATA